MEFELVAAVVMAKEALLGKFGEGSADSGSAQAAELTKALNGDGFLQVSQDATNALSYRLGGWIGGEETGSQSQSRTGLAEV